jgi:hypothetical protein
MIRVELHYANEAHYEKLHTLMAARGMLRYIVADNGSKYLLPPAEYTTVTNSTRDQVVAAAKECAAAVIRSFAVLVTEASAVAWEGLQAA